MDGAHPAIAILAAASMTWRIRSASATSSASPTRRQRVRQPIDEPDGVRHERSRLSGRQFGGQRIERHEERVRRFRVRLVSTLNSVVLPALVWPTSATVNDALWRRSRNCAPPPDLLDVGADRVDPRADAPAVGFELHFFPDPRPDAAAEPRRRSPAPTSRGSR
jgi:hypothetical protein